MRVTPSRWPRDCAKSGPTATCARSCLARIARWPQDNWNDLSPRSRFMKSEKPVEVIATAPTTHWNAHRWLVFRAELYGPPELLPNVAISRYLRGLGHCRYTRLCGHSGICFMPTIVNIRLLPGIVSRVKLYANIDCSVLVVLFPTYRHLTSGKTSKPLVENALKRPKQALN